MVYETRTLITFFGLVSLFLGNTQSVADVQSNLKLMNGGFEQVENKTPKFWNFSGPKNSFLVSDEVRIESKYSMKISLDQYSEEGAWLEQLIEVEAGKRYDFGGAVKTDLEDGLAIIMVTFLDKNGKDIETNSLPEVSHNTPWNYQNQWIKSPNGADIAKIICFAKGKGKAWFDDLHFTTKIRGGY